MREYGFTLFLGVPLPIIHRHKLDSARTQEQARLEFLVQRDGLSAALDFARRTMRIYQTALRYKNPDPGKSPYHFARSVDYVDSFVGSILECRAFIRAHSHTGL